MELFKLFGTIAINNSEANKALEETSDKGNHAESKLSSAFKKIGAAVATYLTVDAIVNFGKGCITAAADANAMASQFSQVFGDLEGQASQSLSKIADNAGITENRMKGSFTKIAAFAKTTGMDTESALALSERAMIAVADSAAFYDRSLEETTESLQSFLKGNFENDAALGLSCTEVTRNEAANRLYGKSFKDLSESQKQLTLLQMVEDANALSGALGQAARESDTWTNVTGNLQQAWKDFQATLGAHGLDLAVDVVKKLVGVLEDCTAKVPEVVAWFGELKTKAEDLGVFSWLSEKIAAARDGFEKVADFAKRLWDNLEPLVTLIRDNLVSAFDGLSEPMGKIKEALQRLQPLFEAIAAVLGGALAYAIGIAVGAFNGIVSAIDGFVTAVSGIAEIVASCFELIVGIFTGDGEKIKEAVEGIGEGIVDVFGGLWDSVSGYVEGFVDGVVGFFTGLWDTLVGHSIVPDTIDGIVNCFGGLWEGVSGFVSDFCENVTGFFGDLKDKAVAKFNEMKEKATEKFNNLKDKASEAAAKTKDNAVKAWDTLKDKTSSIYSAAKDKASSAFSTLKDKVSSAASSTKDKAVSAWNTLKDNTSSAFSTAKDNASSAWTTLKDKVSSTTSSAKDSVSSAWTTLKEKTSSLFSSAKDIATSAFETLKSKITGDASSVESSTGNSFDSMKSKISTAINAAKSTVSSVFSDIKSTISDGVSGALSTVTGKFDSIKEKISSVMESAKSVVSSGISALKKSFDFSWSLPKLKLPHFKISGKFSLDPPSTPKFSIEWYRKAYDKAMILSKPTIFGYNQATGKAMGGGDGNGNEVVSGESHLMNMIGSVVESKTAEQNERIISVLMALLDAVVGGNEELKKALLSGQVIKLNEREFGRAVREYA